MVELARALREVVDGTGLTQTQFGHDRHLSASAVSKALSGKKTPTWETTWTIAGVDADPDEQRWRALWTAAYESEPVTKPAGTAAAEPDMPLPLPHTPAAASHLSLPPGTDRTDSTTEQAGLPPAPGRGDATPTDREASGVRPILGGTAAAPLRPNGHEDNGGGSRRRVPARVSIPVVLIVVGALIYGGFTLFDVTPAPTPAPTIDPVAWSDQVCGALVSYYKPLSQPPSYDGADLDEVQQRLSGYLGAIGRGITAGRDQLRTVGASPVGGGDQFARAIGELLATGDATITSAKSDIDSANPNDANGLSSKMTVARNKLAIIEQPPRLSMPGPTSDLDKAVSAAPKCQEVNQLANAR